MFSLLSLMSLHGIEKCMYETLCEGGGRSGDKYVGGEYSGALV